MTYKARFRFYSGAEMQIEFKGEFTACHFAAQEFAAKMGIRFEGFA